MRNIYRKLWLFIFLLVLFAIPSKDCKAVQIVGINMQGVFSNPVGGQNNNIAGDFFSTGVEEDFISISIFEDILFTGTEALTEPSDSVLIGSMFFFNAESVVDTGASAVDLTITGDGIEFPLELPIFSGPISLTEHITIGHPDTETDTYTFTETGLIVTVPQTDEIGQADIFARLLPPNSPLSMRLVGIVPISSENIIRVGQVVPEPTTITLLGIGLVVLAGAEVRRRGKKKAVDNS